VKDIIIKCLSAASALVLAAETAFAQDLTAGKTPAQLFASDCSACHRSPDGLGKKYNPGSLTGFLRAHYTTKQETAGSLAKYVMGFAAARPVATTSPTAEDARSPDGKHRGDISSDGEKKPRAKPAGTAANEEHVPVPHPAAQPADSGEAAIRPPAPVPANARHGHPAAADSEGTKPAGKPNAHQAHTAAPAAPQATAPQAAAPQVAAPEVQQVAAPAAPQPDSTARVHDYAISGAGAEETAAEAPKQVAGKSHRRTDGEAGLAPPESGEPAGAEIVTGSTPEPAAAATSDTEQKPADAVEKPADASEK
jgi:hypothetical protein